MIFSYNWLKDYVKRLPAPEKLAELLTMHSFEVGEVKKKGGDFALDIDVLPNRAADCFSHLGIARECSVLMNSKFSTPISKLIENKKLKAKDFVSVEIRDKKACLRYSAKVLADVKVGPSPKWLKDRLKVCGLSSINNIVDIVNYVMLEIGQPLHAFDGQKLEGKKIIVRFAKDRERIVTLDGQRFELNPNILVIADAKRPVAIAGVKGGKMPEIDKKTKVVVLESANFNPQVIRQGSRKLNLKTDASTRFEHGLDPNLAEIAINRAAYLIQKVARGKVIQGLIDVYPKKVYPKIIRLNLKYVESLLGVKISAKEIKDILKRLDFKIIDVGRRLMVEAPTKRIDISIPEDLIEEIGRVHGYEKIPASFPVASLIPPKRNEEIFWKNMTKNILKEAGLVEIYNYSFISEKDAKNFILQNLLELENPISKEQKYLRPSLIPHLLNNIQRNQKNFNDIKIFELGKIFIKGKTAVEEKRMLTGAITGDSFYEAKGAADLLLNKLGIGGVWYDEQRLTPEESKTIIYHPKKCAGIKVGNKEIGFLGEISPRILQDLKISTKVVAFDIDFEKLQILASEEHEYMPLSKFPSAIRDLAILVPREIKIVQVLNKINAAGSLLVRDVDLFDIYEGEELPQSKKNLAFHIIYQAQDRTLESKEVDEIHQKIIKALERDPEWQVRR